MDKKLTITAVTKRKALYCKYDRQPYPQPCYLQLDCRSGDLSCGYQSEIGNGISRAEYQDHLHRWPIPCLVSDEANTLLVEVAPVAQSVINGYHSEWDGRNTVGHYTEDAQEALDLIGLICHDLTHSNPETVQIWDADDWFACGDTSVAEDYGITATTTDADLIQIADRIRVEENVDELLHLETYLLGVRDSLVVE